MLSSINRYKWVAIPLICLALAVIFHQPILDYLGESNTPAQTGLPPIATLSTSPSQNVVHFCMDGPPLYPHALAHQAAETLADKLDSLVVPGSSGMIVYASFIASRSYENDAISFQIPAIKAFPLAPAQPAYGSDQYKNSLLKSDYGKNLKAWQQTIMQLQASLSQLQASVKQETNKLRALVSPDDPDGSDIRGCLVEASQHFQSAQGSKTLLIASDLYSSTSSSFAGSFSLPNVRVKVIWHTCFSTTAICSANDGYWKQQMLSAGATSVQFFDPATSNALHVSI